CHRLTLPAAISRAACAAVYGCDAIVCYVAVGQGRMSTFRVVTARRPSTLVSLLPIPGEGTILGGALATARSAPQAASAVYCRVLEWRAAGSPPRPALGERDGE